MGRKFKVDFSNVEDYIRAEEGEHVVELVEIEEKEASTGNPMLAARFKVVKGESTGATLYDNFVLTEKALWKLKAFLSMFGMKVDGRVVIDLDKLEGKRCIAVVAHEEYNGSIRARITDYKKIKAKVEEEVDDWGEDEEEETPKKKKPKKTPVEVEEDDDDDWED